MFVPAHNGIVNYSWGKVVLSKLRVFQYFRSIGRSLSLESCASTLDGLAFELECFKVNRQVAVMLVPMLNCHSWLSTLFKPATFR
jgi:hypothetical protein